MLIGFFFRISYMGGGVNQAYSRLSTTDGHITDCNWDSVVYAGACVWVNVDLSCLGRRFNSATGEQRWITQTIYTDSEPPSRLPNSFESTLGYFQLLHFTVRVLFDPFWEALNYAENGSTSRKKNNATSLAHVPMTHDWRSSLWKLCVRVCVCVLFFFFINKPVCRLCNGDTTVMSYDYFCLYSSGAEIPYSFAEYNRDRVVVVNLWPG